MSFNSIPWSLGQQNRIVFVMVDSSSVEVTGLTLSIQISKDGGAFSASAGTWGEIGSGFYWYLSTSGEADTVGPIAIVVTAVGAAQQNLEYIVLGRHSTAQERDYQITDSDTLLPIQGVEIVISIDSAGSKTIWAGVTRTDGYAIDSDGVKPYLQNGIYYFWASKPGFTPDAFPDVEVFT